MEPIFEEILTASAFENLVRQYFIALKDLPHKKPEIIDIETIQVGEGPDGGKDTIVTFRVTDEINPFTRKWVVQCKHYKRVLGKSDLADVNIPTLIHSHKAVGYLLVCSNSVSQSVVDYFERLSQNCIFEYGYVIWNGFDFNVKLNTLFPESVLKTFFPKYFKSLLR